MAKINDLRKWAVYRVPAHDSEDFRVIGVVTSFDEKYVEGSEMTIGKYTRNFTGDATREIADIVLLKDADSPVAEVTACNDAGLGMGFVGPPEEENEVKP